MALPMPRTLPTPRTLLALLLTGALLAGCARGSATDAPSLDDDAGAQRAAQAFLTRWVGPDGQVDEGGGTAHARTQAYALLLAVAADDPTTVERVWAWTSERLLRPDGLLWTRWAGRPDGRARHASDGDLLTAWALALAGQRFDRPALRQAAHALATAVMRREVGTGSLARPTLAAGPWAVHPDGATVEPGYLAPPAVAALAALTGDPRWHDLGAAWLAHLRALMRQGEALPPEWARVDSRTARPLPGPDGRSQHGPEALRAPVWASCTALGRALVAPTWSLLAEPAAAPAARALNGRPTDRTPAPLSAVAAAATASAAGRYGDAQALLERADALAQARPTAYGDAWAALGGVLLTSDRLADCG